MEQKSLGLQRTAERGEDANTGEQISASHEAFGFEVLPEVQAKIKKAKGIRALIKENGVSDLKFIDVSSRRYQKIKRLLDIFISGLGLLILIIPLLIVGLFIYIDEPGNIIFSQYRVGLHGKRFKLYKLRTMKMDTPKYLSTQEMNDPDKHITRVGHILRKFSIDEIPQLFNVLKGDMSLIGPRPLISDEYEIHEMRMRFGVYNVRPGITGLAQINGRDMVSPVEKVHWDVRYLQNYGLKQDVKILFLTVPQIFGGVGVVEGTSAQAKRDCRS